MLMSCSGGVSHRVTETTAERTSSIISTPVFKLSLDGAFCHPLLWAITTVTPPPPRPSLMPHVSDYPKLVRRGVGQPQVVCLTALWQDAVVWHPAALLPHNYDLPRTHVRPPPPPTPPPPPPMVLGCAVHTGSKKLQAASPLEEHFDLVVVL